MAPSPPHAYPHSARNGCQRVRSCGGVGCSSLPASVLQMRLNAFVTGPFCVNSPPEGRVDARVAACAGCEPRKYRGGERDDALLESIPRAGQGSPERRAKFVAAHRQQISAQNSLPAAAAAARTQTPVPRTSPGQTSTGGTGGTGGRRRRRSPEPRPDRR
ncbi:unnamed protein product [Lampetra fluviatilis]